MLLTIIPAIVLALLSLPIHLVDAATSSVMRHAKPLPRKFSDPKLTLSDRHRPAVPSLETIYHFHQLIDHNNKHLGTFEQRYWMNWEFYRAGGPIVLTTPGESSAHGYTSSLTNDSITGMIAQKLHGATVLIEHRFFGHSNPRHNLSSESLELLTVQQAIDDFVYFAQNVQLPMPGGGNVKPSTTPWILAGGSYAGALTAWTMVNRPGIFHAGYASSAVVEAMTDYYGYFTPIREYMPQNCSADVQAVIAYLDRIHAEKNTKAIQSLKEAFGLGGLSHIDDFAAALQENLANWQDLDVGTKTDSKDRIFYRFCDALEVKDGVSAPPSGWGLKHAIHSWGTFWKKTYYAHQCKDDNDAESCLGTYNANDAYYKNITLGNDDRSWNWMKCNELGYYTDGPPEGQPAIVSRIVKPSYWEKQCVKMFPEKFPSSRAPSAGKVNEMYAGWNIEVDRLVFVNGRRDPWREVTVSAEGLNKISTSRQPIYLTDGFHTSDMDRDSGTIDKTIHAAQMAVLEHMEKWLKEWHSA